MSIFLSFDSLLMEKAWVMRAAARPGAPLRLPKSTEVL
jgi:hypothetical protein